MQRNYEGRGTKSFPVISGCATFLIHQCIYQFRSSPNVLFRHFYNPVSRPFLLSKCWWVGMKVLTLESFVWYFWWPDPSWSYNIDRDIRKKNLYIYSSERPPSVWCSHIVAVPAWVFSGFFGFLPHLKDMYVRWICISELRQHDWVCLLVWVSPVMKGIPSWVGACLCAEMPGQAQATHDPKLESIVWQEFFYLFY